MVTIILVHVAAKLARYGKEVRQTWRETRRLRRTVRGKREE
jgi:hypothetical protein